MLHDIRKKTIISVLLSGCILLFSACGNKEVDQNTESLTKEEVSFEVTNENDTMVPYDTELLGAHGGYIFIPINGETYRYETGDQDITDYTISDLIYEYTEEDIPGEVYEHSVYSILEYPDYSVLYDVSKDQKYGDEFQVFIKYCPTMGVSSDIIDAVLKSGYVIMKDGSVISGKEEWLDFYNMVTEGESATVRIVTIYTLEDDNCSEDLYEAAKYDYPFLFMRELSFDGEKYVTSPVHFDGENYNIEYVEGYDTPEKEWKYLKHFTGKMTADNPIYSGYDRYILVNDENVDSWDDIMMSYASSTGEGYISSEEVFCELTLKE